MIEKLIWSQKHIKTNPFGGQEGFRPLRITFHDQSFINLSNEDAKILEILTGLATLNHIDAMSFEGQVYPKIIIDLKESEDGLFNLQTIDSSQSHPIHHGGIYKVWLDGSGVEGLCVRAHSELNRDIFITLSDQLIKNRDEFDDTNIATPLEALKIVSICLRARNEFDWMREIKGNETFPASRGFFYEYLTRGLLPNKWKYLSVLGSHPKREELIQLRWSVNERCSRALQARDEIARLYYKPETTDAQDLRSYHFAYLTILLTGALDAQALIINKVYNLDEIDQNCKLHNKNFKKRIRNNALTKGIGNLLDSKEQFIKEILVELRNKIHSVSLKEDYRFPENDQDELKKLLECIYNYDTNSHWGVQKQNIIVIKKEKTSVPSFKYTINTYILGFHLIAETFVLINALMEEIKADDISNKSDLAKLKTEPSTEMDKHIQTCLLLG